MRVQLGLFCLLGICLAQANAVGVTSLTCLSFCRCVYHPNNEQRKLLCMVSRQLPLERQLIPADLTAIVLNDVTLPPLPTDLLAGSEILTTLRMTNNSVTQLPEAFLDGTPLLTTIAVTHNLLETLPERLFANTPALSHMDFSFNRIDRLPEEIVPAQVDLRSFVLRSNPLAGEEVCPVARLYTVTSLTTPLLTASVSRAVLLLLACCNELELTCRRTGNGRMTVLCAAKPVCQSGAAIPYPMLRTTASPDSPLSTEEMPTNLSMSGVLHKSANGSETRNMSYMVHPHEDPTTILDALTTPIPLSILCGAVFIMMVVAVLVVCTKWKRRKRRKQFDSALEKGHSFQVDLAQKGPVQILTSRTLRKNNSNVSMIDVPAPDKGKDCDDNLPPVGPFLSYKEMAGHYKNSVIPDVTDDGTCEDSSQDMWPSTADGCTQTTNTLDNDYLIAETGRCASELAWRHKRTSSVRPRNTTEWSMVAGLQSLDEPETEGPWNPAALGVYSNVSCDRIGSCDTTEDTEAGQCSSQARHAMLMRKETLLHMCREADERGDFYLEDCAATLPQTTATRATETTIPVAGSVENGGSAGSDSKVYDNVLYSVKEGHLHIVRLDVKDASRWEMSPREPLELAEHCDSAQYQDITRRERGRRGSISPTESELQTAPLVEQHVFVADNQKVGILNESVYECIEHQVSSIASDNQDDTASASSIGDPTAHNAAPVLADATPNRKSLSYTNSEVKSTHVAGTERTPSVFTAACTTQRSAKVRKVRMKPALRAVTSNPQSISSPPVPSRTTSMRPRLRPKPRTKARATSTAGRSSAAPAS